MKYKILLTLICIATSKLHSAEEAALAEKPFYVLNTTSLTDHFIQVNGANPGEALGWRLQHPYILSYVNFNFKPQRVTLWNAAQQLISVHNLAEYTHNPAHIICIKKSSNGQLKTSSVWLRTKPDLGQIGIFNISDHHISRPSFVHTTLSHKRSILTLKSTMAPSNNPKSHVALTCDEPELDGALLTSAYHSTDNITVFQARKFEKEKHNFFMLFDHTDDAGEAGIGLINFVVPK